MNDVTIRQITMGSDAYPRLLDLRNRMLRVPLGMNLFEEDLSRDVDDVILTAYEKDHLIGCVMLKPLNEKEVKLRAMAVDEEFQGRGIGRRLVEHAEDLARQKGFETIVLNARVTAKEFYNRMGYDTVSDEFIEVTIPHVAMQKHIG
ncbi:MAG TPA: GNAT family N-acetyltransferase [Flavipsychrobacter sp.]|nr:GNAT family N-acetyltransferase [Flavipsychrobacter sp.]